MFGKTFSKPCVLVELVPNSISASFSFLTDTIYHMSCVTCHLSPAMCQVSGFTCKFELVGGGSVINGATPSSFSEKQYMLTGHLRAQMKRLDAPNTRKRHIGSF